MAEPAERACFAIRRADAGRLDDAARGRGMMRNIALAAMLVSVLTVSSAHSQSEDPKAQQRRDAKEIDAQYEHARKASSWAKTPKPLIDPWQSVKPAPPGEKK
jgi:hypothetical protein